MRCLYLHAFKLCLQQCYCFLFSCPITMQVPLSNTHSVISTKPAVAAPVAFRTADQQEQCDAALAFQVILVSLYIHIRSLWTLCAMYSPNAMVFHSIFVCSSEVCSQRRNKRMAGSISLAQRMVLDHDDLHRCRAHCSQRRNQRTFGSTLAQCCFADHNYLHGCRVARRRSLDLMCYHVY